MIRFCLPQILLFSERPDILRLCGYRGGRSPAPPPPAPPCPHPKEERKFGAAGGLRARSKSHMDDAFLLRTHFRKSSQNIDRNIDFCGFCRSSTSSSPWPRSWGCEWISTETQLGLATIDRPQRLPEGLILIQSSQACARQNHIQHVCTYQPRFMTGVHRPPPYTLLHR